MYTEILNNLPGYNCGACGYRSCNKFADDLCSSKTTIEKCPYLETKRYAQNVVKIKQLLPTKSNDINEEPSKNGAMKSTVTNEPQEKDPIIGVIDGLRADFVIAPLPGEPSCREDIYPFDQTVCLKKDDYVKYRPLGCPVTHFAKILNFENRIATIHLIGPRHRFDPKSNIEFQDIGVCMVAAFLGIIVKGKIPAVCQTVKFLPEHCMMQKIHSGIIVMVEKNVVRIEGIDLKVFG